MINAGGLIKLHYHDHFDVLEAFDDVNNILYYKDVPLFQNIQISECQHNHLIRKSDGLFVDGAFLDRFDYHDNELYFDNIIVSREYTNQQITDMVDSLWSPNPYLTVGKIDLTYWFELVYSSDKLLNYRNNSTDMTMHITINNPNNQTLQIYNDDIPSYDNTNVIHVDLLPSTNLIIRENDLNALNEVSVILE